MKKKVILLTGSSRGIGRVTAITLAQKGYQVYATMRHPTSSTDFSDLNFDNLIVKILDVTDNDSIVNTVNEIIDREGQLDVVINNAGYGLLAPVEMATEEDVQAQFDVNVFGVLRVIQAALPQMRKQKSGHIINISSIAGLVSNPGLGLYCATKHAVEAISASLAATVFPWNIKVTVVEPGATVTEFAEVMQVGTNLENDNPYKNFTKRYRQHMINLLKEGQPSAEIAELISEIIEMEKPDFRYQTSERLKEVAKQLVTDPTGNIWLDDVKDTLTDWFEQ